MPGTFLVFHLLDDLDFWRIKNIRTFDTCFSFTSSHHRIYHLSTILSYDSICIRFIWSFLVQVECAWRTKTKDKSKEQKEKKRKPSSADACSLCKNFILESIWYLSLFMYCVCAYYNSYAWRLLVSQQLCLAIHTI